MLQLPNTSLRTTPHHLITYIPRILTFCIIQQDTPFLAYSHETAASVYLAALAASDTAFLIQTIDHTPMVMVNQDALQTLGVRKERSDNYDENACGASTCTPS